MLHRSDPQPYSYIHFIYLFPDVPVFGSHLPVLSVAKHRSDRLAIHLLLGEILHIAYILKI